MSVPAPTTLRMLQVAMGDEARYGLSEEWEDANPHELARTWVGKALFFGTPFDEVAKIRWTANNGAIRGEPAWDWVRRGTRMTLQCLKCRTLQIPQGTLSARTYWPIVPGSTVVASLAISGQRVPVNVAYATGTVTLQAAQADDVVAYYRPLVDVLVLSWGGGASQQAGTQTWTAEFAGYAPPQAGIP